MPAAQRKLEIRSTKLKDFLTADYADITDGIREGPDAGLGHPLPLNPSPIIRAIRVIRGSIFIFLVIRNCFELRYSDFEFALLPSVS